MMSYREIMDADRRLVILRLLSESGGYQANEYLLHSALPGFGHTVSHDRVRADLDWLAEQGLVTVTATGELRVATLTARGLDVAAGRAEVSGVKRPDPEI